MDEYSHKDKDEACTSINTSFSTVSSTQHSAEDSSQEELQHETQAEHRSARSGKNSRGVDGLLKKRRSSGALSAHPTTGRREQQSSTNVDSKRLSSNARRKSLMTAQKDLGSVSNSLYSPRQSLSPKISQLNAAGSSSINRSFLSPKSPSLRMKLVPSSRQSASLHSKSSPESRRRRVSESIADALADLPLAPTMPMQAPVTPSIRSRKTLLQSDNYRRMSNSLTNLTEDLPLKNVPLASHFKNRDGLDTQDVFDLDPFDDSHILGEIDAFSIDEDDEFLSSNKSGDSLAGKSAGSKSRNSASVISVKTTKTSSASWDDFMEQNQRRSKSYDSLQSNVEEMKRSLHETEKEKETEIQKRDEIILKLTEQLRIAKGGHYDDQKINGDTNGNDDGEMATSEPKSRSGHFHRKSSKKEKGTDRGTSTTERRRSTGGFENSKKDKKKGNSSRKLLKKERKSTSLREMKAEEDMSTDNIAVLFSEDQAPPTGADLQTPKTKRRDFQASPQVNGVHDQKKSQRGKLDSKEKKKKVKKKSKS
eukprot:scaffold713_cov131-Cylindrotheca_fusiformis.AAC.27